MKRCECNHLLGTHLRPQGKCAVYECLCTEYKEVEFVGESSVRLAGKELIKTEELPIPVTSYIALSNKDLINSKNILTEWCTKRLAEIKTHLSNYQENLKIAVKNKWRVSGLRAAVSRTKLEVNYYTKIKLAVDAGYLIIPNFPMEVFAVMTVRHYPPKDTRINAWPSNLRGSATTPPNEGRYVSDEAIIKGSTYLLNDKEQSQRWNDDFKDVSFPITAAKPVLVEAAAKAMNLKIFDELGIARGIKESRRKDPVLIGKIIGPSTGYQKKEISFFIAWWLNIDDI